MPVIACQNCGQEFQVFPCHVKDGVRKFCSRRCRHSSQSGGREQIVALRKQGRKLKEIAEETGFSEGYVRSTMMREGLAESQRHRQKRGQRSRRRVVELRQQGWKQQEIADQLRLTVGYVKRILTREGLTQPQQYRERGQASQLRLVELRNQGLSPQEIAEATGFTRGYVRQQLNRAGLVVPRKNDKRAHHERRRAKTALRSQRVIELRKQGWKLREIAEETGYSIVSTKQHLQRAGLTKPPRSPNPVPSECLIWTAEEDAILRYMTESGESVQSIAAELDRTVLAIKNRRAHLGITGHALTVRRHQTHAAIANLVKKGVRTSEIASVVGCSPDQVRSVKKKLRMAGKL